MRQLAESLYFGLMQTSTRAALSTAPATMERQGEAVGCLHRAQSLVLLRSVSFRAQFCCFSRLLCGTADFSRITSHKLCTIWHVPWHSSAESRVEATNFHRPRNSAHFMSAPSLSHVLTRFQCRARHLFQIQPHLWRKTRKNRIKQMRQRKEIRHDAVRSTRQGKLRAVEKTEDI
jgi:hypothetical protein